MIRMSPDSIGMPGGNVMPMARSTVLRAPSARTLRIMFRRIYERRGGGVEITFANVRERHVSRVLIQLAASGVITEPVYNDNGSATVTTVEPLAFSEPLAEPISQQNVAGEELVANDEQASSQVSEDEESAPVADTQPPVNNPVLKAPPTSGPGSSADAWRAYAAAVTSTPAEVWSGLERSDIIETLRARGILNG